jgi:hypothetical protein
MFVLIGGTLLIASSLAGDSAFSEVTKLVTLGGTIFLASGLLHRNVKSVEGKTDDQTKTLDRIDTAVNGRLDRRFLSLEGRLDRLESVLHECATRFDVVEARLEEIVDILTKPQR